MQLGFSTECFQKFIQPVSLEAIELACNLGSNIIELAAYELEHISFLKNITKDDIKYFKYLSFHGPGHDEMIKFGEKGQREALDSFQEIYERLNFDCLVLHPGEWIVDWEIFNDYTFPIAFENMDWRHKIGADVASMKEILGKKNFKMVLDLNHVYTHDNTMELAKDFYENFKDKIVHYHLSGIEDEGENCHVPLYRSQREIILNAIPDLNLPIIIENVCTDVEDARKEIKYIKSVISLKS